MHVYPDLAFEPDMAVDQDTAIDPDTAVAEHGRAQFGAFSHDQAQGAGFSRGAIRHRLASGRWVRAELPRVYVFPGAPKTWRQRLMVATLCAGDDAAVSHRAAAALHRIPGFAEQRSEITLTARCRSLEGGGVVVHVSRPWSSPDRVHVDHLPVTSVARTLVDLAGCLDPKRLERAVDDCLVTRLTTVIKIQVCAERHLGAGRRGSGNLRRILADRAGHPPLESELEARLLDLIVSAGLPLPERQFVVADAEFIGRVDFAYPKQRVILEVDSFRFHASHSDLRRDQLRKARLAAAGWRVIPIGWAMLRDDPGGVIRLIRDALGI